MTGVQRGTLVAILVLGACLRWVGIGWGVPSPDHPHPPFHPDETWAMSALCTANLAAGDLVIEEAHLEGSFLAYAFLTQALVLDGVGVIDDLPCPRSVAPGDSVYAQPDYRRLLLANRSLVAALDVLAILVVFVIANRLTSPWPSLASAAIFATLPFEAVHAHYMRSHTPSNLAILLVLLAALGLVETQTRRRIVWVGCLCGLAAATRYTSIVALIVPGWILASRLFRSYAWTDLRRSSEVFRDLWVLAGSALVGFVVCQPPLLWAFDEVMEPVGRLLTYVPAEQFSAAGLFDWSKIWDYLTYLLPHAAGGGYYALFTLATVYVLFLKRYHPVTLPWAAMNATYLFFMAKGYVEPVFARAVLNLFPVLVLYTAIALHDMARRLSSTRGRALLVAGCLGVVGWTLVFDAAYLRSMTDRRDARYLVHDYLKADGRGRVGTIGVFEDDETGYFTTLPALVVGSDLPRLEVSSEFHAEMPDLERVVVAGYMERYSVAEERVKDLAEHHGFVLDFTAVPTLSFLSVSFDHRRLPADMQYPFVELFVLQPAASP